jgi:hypothetical protein
MAWPEYVAFALAAIVIAGAVAVMVIDARDRRRHKPPATLGKKEPPAR